MRSFFSLYSYLSVPFIAVLFSSCASMAPVGEPAAYLADYRTQPGQVGDAVPSPEENGYWDGDGVSGEALIRINIGDQKAYFYKGNQLVAQTSISTGTEGRVTPRGRFKVTQKSKDHHSSLYGVIKDNATGAIVNDDAKVGKDIPRAGQTFVRAPMPNFLRFNNAIGMHTGHLPGYAASHGCVRLPDFMAKHFFQSASLGTPVIVE
jgi:lipoprotein-anchoring transpeptidase ErfK/SrfK